MAVAGRQLGAGSMEHDLPTDAFRTTEGLAAGVPYRVLHSDLFVRPSRGVRATSAASGVAERARSILPVLPHDAAFSHLTACQLHELPLSYAMEADERLHLTRPIAGDRLRRPGLVCHRALHPRLITSVDGLATVDLADTWVDLGELVGRGKPVGLDDLIVVGDAAATRLDSVAPLAAAVARRVRPRGKVTLLEALEEIRVGSASPRESTSRLMLVRSGLPEPQLNEPVRDAFGRLIGVGDLCWKKQRVVGEYQGEEFHDSPEQRLADDIRRGRFRRNGWRVEEIWKADLASTAARHACVLRFAAALGVPVSQLSLGNAEPRFFSTHAMELATQRDERMRRRTA